MTREEYDQKVLNGGLGAVNLPPYEELVRQEAEAEKQVKSPKEKPSGDA